MKTSLLIILLLSANSLLFGQAQNCKPLHKGKFRLVSGDTTMIERTKKLQIEESADVKMIFDLTWVDDCTYELRARQLLKGDPKYAPKEGQVIRVRIKEIKTNSYICESTSNYSDLVLESEIEILR